MSSCTYLVLLMRAILTGIQNGESYNERLLLYETIWIKIGGVHYGEVCSVDEKVTSETES